MCEIVVPTRPDIPCCDFTAYPQYINPITVESEYIQERYIGSVRPMQGASGKVYLYRNRFLDTQFACKVVKVTSDFLLKGAVLEYETLLALHHPHIVGVYGLSLLMDFLPVKSLSQLLHESHVFPGTKYPEAEVKLLARQVLSALSYLDSKGLVHRDINPSNILWTGTHATLIDFQTVCTLSLSGPQGPSRYSALLGP